MAKFRAALTALENSLPLMPQLGRPHGCVSCWLALVLLMLWTTTGLAESSQEVQFLPEIDAYLKLSTNYRVDFQVKDTREGGDSNQAAIGPGVQIYLKPLVRLKEITTFDLDDAKSRPLVLAASYSYLFSPGSPSTNRIPIEATSHLPMKGKFLASDRNRIDLDWSSGDFTWRYRNLVSLQRTLTIGSHHPTPYVSAEFYYESQYGKFSTTELDAGSIFPVTKRFQLKAYYEHQNNTGKKHNEQVHGIGLALNMYFSREKH